MPFHRQKWTEWFHESKIPTELFVMEALKESKACWSVMLSEYAQAVLVFEIIEVAENNKAKSKNCRKLELIVVWLQRGCEVHENL